jgi:hypothetical protein
LKTGAFTGQKQRMGTPLFLLWDFEKSENAKSSWYHWLKLTLVARTGIEPVSRFIASTFFTFLTV